ncbi:MAG: glycosyltransferase family 2 protein [Steroidobacteraceae bacterium]
MALALVTIARNEAACIQRMLQSVETIVDEIVVVDTGSTDETVELARAGGASVSHYAWNDDFSKARNFALSLTKCPWRLVLDADEWLLSGADVLQEIKQRSPDFVGQIEIVSGFTDPAYPSERFESRDRVSRLLPTGVTYVGAIHEQPTHQLPIVAVPVVLGHDGYEPLNLSRKGDRNLQLLHRSLEGEPFDSYLAVKYAKELKRFSRFEEASLVLRRVIKTLSESQTTPHWREDVVCLALEIFAETREFSAGLELIESEADELSASVDFWFCVGVFSFRIAENVPSAAREALARMESAFSYCLELGAKGERSRIVCGRESWLAERNLAAYRGAK